MEAFQAAGRWWLYEDPGHKVPGTLVVSKSGRSELRLIGSLRSARAAGEAQTDGGMTTAPFSSIDIHESGVYPRIVGQSGSKVYTLEDCFRTHRSGSLMGDALASEVIHVHQVLRGAAFEPGESLEFTALHARMDWLAYWMQMGGISEEATVPETPGNAPEHTLTIQSVDPVEFAGPDGARLQLSQTWEITGDLVTERKLSQDFVFSVRSDTLAPLAHLLTYAGLIQDLVSMGTGESAAFSSISLRHPDIAREVQERSYHLPIDLFAQWIVKNKKQPKLRGDYHMPFSLEKLGGAQGVERWLQAVWPHRGALARVMSTRYSPNRYVGDLFWNCASALEGYDRRKHNDDISYVQRIRRCARLAGDVFTELVGDPDKWSEVIKQRRNDVAHHNPGVDAAGTEQFILGRTAYWAFALCILRDAEAPQAAFANIGSHSEFAWLKTRVRDLALY